MFDQPAALKLLADLIAFDTTSDRSNLGLIEYLESYLASFGVPTWRAATDEGSKCNLLARLGPESKGGILFSSHTDVVPAASEHWATNPFAMTQSGSRVYGRGATDMKGFIAACLGCVPDLVKGPLREPVYLAFSYDEEVGCLGVHEMIVEMKRRSIRPRGCVIGEPTNMQVGIAHKGNRTFRLHFTGKAAHSSLAPTAVNAVAFAAEFVTGISRAAAAFETGGPFAEGFDVRHTTAHVGVISGGEQVNIVPSTCTLDVEFRHLPEQEADELERRLILEPISRLDTCMKARDDKCGVELERVYAYPGLDMPDDDDFVTLAKRNSGNTGHTKLAFGTEAGCFAQGLHVPAIVCGPGDIKQAHQVDEFLEISQLESCQEFILRIVQDVCHNRHQ